MTDYPCAKFGNFGLGLSHFGFIMRTDTQNHRDDDRYTNATIVGVSNDYVLCTHNVQFSALNVQIQKKTFHFIEFKSRVTYDKQKGACKMCSCLNELLI